MHWAGLKHVVKSYRNQKFPLFERFGGSHSGLPPCYIWWLSSLMQLFSGPGDLTSHSWPYLLIQHLSRFWRERPLSFQGYEMQTQAWCCVSNSSPSSETVHAHPTKPILKHNCASHSLGWSLWPAFLYNANGPLYLTQMASPKRDNVHCKFYC